LKLGDIEGIYESNYIDEIGKCKAGAAIDYLRDAIGSLADDWPIEYRCKDTYLPRGRLPLQVKNGSCSNNKEGMTSTRDKHSFPTSTHTCQLNHGLLLLLDATEPIVGTDV